MIRFKVLNEEDQSKSKEEESIEIQAEKCLGIYQSAIRLLQKSRVEEARRMFKNLIDSDFMQKLGNDSEIAAKGTPLRLLQYLVYSNYASILEQCSDAIPGSALHFYLKAAMFDNSDNSLWIKIGTIAAKEKKYKLARYALESGLQQSSIETAQKPAEDDLYSAGSTDRDLTPTQWSCLETICEVLFEIGDYTACLDYVQKALKISPYFSYGLELQDKIQDNLNYTRVQGNFDRSTSAGPEHSNDSTRDGPKELVLETPTWQSLGELLVQEYKDLLAHPEKDFYNQRLVVKTVSLHLEDVEMAEEVTTEEMEEISVDTTIGANEGKSTEGKVVLEKGVPEQSENALPVMPDDAMDHDEKEGSESEQVGALKRKRKEVEERSGLRTSKRVRDKLDQFEVTKKKREEEELETLAKYKIVLAKFGLDLENAFVRSTLPNGCRPEEIFPKGLSPLLHTFNRHLERPNSLVQASTLENMHQHKTNHFAIFTPETCDRQPGPFFKDSTCVLSFIEKTNEINGGVTEYLCRFIMTVMSGIGDSTAAESKWQQKWPEGLRPIVCSAISMLEDQLIEYLSQESHPDDTPEEQAQVSVPDFQLSVCEMLLDEIVHAILQPFTAAPRKGKNSKKVDIEASAKLEKQFQRWLFLVDIGLGSNPHPLQTRVGSNGYMRWAQTAVVRLHWMMGRHDQCSGNPASAIVRFETCLGFLREDPGMVVNLPNCKYDDGINADLVHERLERLKMHQYVLDAERLFKEEEYAAVVMRLEPIFLIKREETEADEAASTIGGSLSERLELMSLLYRSCQALDLYEKQFQCVAEMFISVVDALVNSVTEKSEAVDVWYLFNQLAQMLLLMRESLARRLPSGLIRTLEGLKLQKLVCCVLAVTRLGFVNVLHQDRLVDDDIKISYSDLLKNRPHLEQFNVVLVRVWVVLLLLLPGWFQEVVGSSEAQCTDRPTDQPLPLVIKPLDPLTLNMDAETMQRVLSQHLTSNSSTPLRAYTGPSQDLYMELIALVHDDLGVREICGIDNGQLIRLALNVSSPMQGEFYRKEENQCYYCFYGISLSVDGQYPIEHSSQPVDFDKKAAIEFFPLLERSLSDKVLRGQVRGDLKDAVDRVEEALGAPPYESNAALALNRQLVENYLGSEVNFAEAIQGKIFLAQFRNRAKNNQFKPLEDLQQAIDQFRTDIHVNPDSWDSWYSLAVCYASLADENLVFSASDIKNNFSKITDLHRRSFHCYSQAARLAPKRTLRAKVFDGELKDSSMMDTDGSHEDVGRVDPASSDSDAGLNGQIQHSDEEDDREWCQKQSFFWFDFGYLVHGIMSKPMRMEAMRQGGGLEALSLSGDQVTVRIPEPTEDQVYKFAAFCFKRSLLLNGNNWRAPLMLGKCIEKLGGKPNQVLSLYKMAADKVPSRSGQPGNEKIFEAAYKFISTLTKYLEADKIAATVVESLMARMLEKSQLGALDGETFIFEAPKEYAQGNGAEPACEDDSQRRERMHAFRLLCEGLARIRHTDKRHWHHRPVYRQAWILYSIYHDVERAKAAMLSLFQIKSNAKTLVSSVWKPEFERCGKHFIYVGEYTKFLIVLAKESKDVETLGSLARKIRRAQGLLLDLKGIWELLYDSYLSVLGDLVGLDPDIAVAEVIPRVEFREKAPIYETRMFEQEPKPAGLAVLQKLCELKKLNEKMAPEGQMGHFLAVCYSKLFVEVGGAELYPKGLIQQLSGHPDPPPPTKDSANDMGTDAGSGAMPQTSVAPSKRPQALDEGGDDEEEIRLKMAKLATASSTELWPDSSKGSNVATPIIALEDRGRNEGDLEGKVISGRDQSTALNPPPATDSSSLGPANESQENEAPALNMEMEVDMESWKKLKKITASELASRATAMCKVPPPSLKAPLSIQSKLAGPESGYPQENVADQENEGEHMADPALLSTVDEKVTSADETVDSAKSNEGNEENSGRTGNRRNSRDAVV